MISRVIEFSIKHIFLVLSMVVIMLFLSVGSLKKISLDVLPDLSPTQVILEVSYKGQSPNIIEEQVVYPLISSLMSLSNIETIRSMSSFESAMIYIIFKDGSDIYSARSRILEQLASLLPMLPQNAKVTLGPDASGVGWVYQYALKSKDKDLSELKDYQDYYLKYALLSVDGVSEVSSVGGFKKNYQISINQDRLVGYDIFIEDVLKAIKSNNQSSGGGVSLENGYEHILQANGYIKDIADLENITIKVASLTPIKLKDIATIEVVPDSRRGVAELNGEGEVVGGIVVVRYHQNSYDVIQRVKQKIASLAKDGVELVEVYDRTSLIDKAIATLKRTLLEEMLIVMVVIVLFLSHFRSVFVIILTLPLSVLATLYLMNLFGIGSNIMSLGGIAIAIGAMIDASIVMVENAHKHLLHKPNEDRIKVIIDSSKQVGGAIFFALMLVVVSFLPIFALEAQEAKLFHPLAYTKTFAMMIGAVLSITLIPILMVFFLKGEIKREDSNLLNRFFMSIYTPVLKIVLRFRYIAIVLSVLAFMAIYPLYKAQKWEFMPQLNEHSFMYMPVTPYGIGIDLAKDILSQTNEIIKSFPEVKSVFGKAGRADSATDPAPLAMIESIITFQDESKWRDGVTYESLMREMDNALQVKGLMNSWTYPIRGRVDMLLTGIRTPLGIKIYGDDNAKLEVLAKEVEEKLKGISQSVIADRSNRGYFLDIDIKQELLSRYGITKDDILSVVSYGVGGLEVDTHLDGLKRHKISLRYDASQRDTLDSLKNLKIKTNVGFLPLDMFATLSYKESPSVISSERGMKVSYVYIIPKSGISVDEYTTKATKFLQEVEFPSGYYYEFAGESKNLESAKSKLMLITPVVLIVIFIFIYLALKSFEDAVIVFVTLPFAMLGGLLYMEFLGYNLSVASVVGFLALLGIAAETAIVMMIYLNEAMKHKKGSAYEAVIDGSVGRLRPKLMTLFAILGGLMPIMYVDGVGSEVMRKIAAPMIGGIVTSAMLTLLIIPVLYYTKVLFSSKIAK